MTGKEKEIQWQIPFHHLPLQKEKVQSSVLTVPDATVPRKFSAQQWD